MSSRETIRGSVARAQSVSEPPAMETVKVAVLPPRLPPGMAPPTGVAAADAFDWDESINWVHNEKIVKDQPVSSSKNFLRKAGLTTQRKKKNENTPPFIFREVPYDTWRKHYAKDKEGRYRGTLAPAEDCLLLPEDVEKWRAHEPETKADLWTRGKVALPVYEEAQNESFLPPYNENYDQPPKRESDFNSGFSNSANEELPPRAQSTSFSIEGKTSEQIIEEHKQKLEVKKQTEPRRKSWKDSIKRGTEWGLMGSGNGGGAFGTGL